MIRSRRRRALLVPATLLVIVGAVLLSTAMRLTPHVRDIVVTALNDRFDSKVALESLQVVAFPRPEVVGSGLAVRHRGRTDVPPLVAIQSFSSSAGLLGLMGTPLHLRTVELEGLTIYLPPDRLHGSEPPGRKDAARPDSVTTDADHRSPIAIDRIVSRAAQLSIASKEAGKLPRVFDIHDLVLDGFAFDRAAAFKASLTNPTPRGRIETSGTFGPWHRDEPRRTPLGGHYDFKNADLDTIDGIGGLLSSTGTYRGVLERVEVEGETNTPDFVVDIAGQPVPLKTRFKAVVDGTNGNTWLEQVEARVLSSTILARGAVVRTEDVKGRKVELDVNVTDARIEDLLRLAVKSSRPPLTGAVTLKTRFVLPAGKQDVIRKLQLDGAFNLAQARFTDFNVQKRINTLSSRGRGDETDTAGESVVSNLRGRFVLRDAALRFHELTFAVPGAVVRLTGSYALDSEALDFSGDLLLDAALADTTSGIKAVAARIAQPLFRRSGGGSRLPIRVSGSRSKPVFGLDVKRALTPGD